MTRYKNPLAPDRREFLKLAAGATLGGALGGALTGALGAPVANPVGGFAQEPGGFAAKVAVVRDGSVRAAVREAVGLSGGLDFIEPGQRVLIKTNATGGVLHPMTTNPEVLFEIVKMVGEAGCDNIIVGDRSFFFIEDVAGVLKRIGHFDAAKQAEQELGGGVKVHVVALDDAHEHMTPGSPTWREIRHPLSRHYVDGNGNNIGFRLAEILFQVDHIINVPCCKTHFQAWFTMSMKSFVGMSHPDTRRFFHRFSTINDLRDQSSPGKAEIQPDVTPFTNRLVELNLPLAPALNVIDATVPVVHGGPSSGDTMTADVIIASRDRIAADVAGVALLRTLGTERRLQTVSPWKNPMIRYARRLGIGVKRRSELEVITRGLEDEAAYLANMA